MIQAYLTKTNLDNRVDRCHFAYTSYEKICIQLKSYLRGLSCDINMFLNDTKYWTTLSSINARHVINYLKNTIVNLQSSLIDFVTNEVYDTNPILIVKG